MMVSATRSSGLPLLLLLAPATCLAWDTTFGQRVMQKCADAGGTWDKSRGVGHECQCPSGTEYDDSAERCVKQSETSDSSGSGRGCGSGNYDVGMRALSAGYNGFQAGMLQAAANFANSVGCNNGAAGRQAAAEAAKREQEKRAREAEIRRQEEERRRKFEADKSELLSGFKMDGGGAPTDALQFKDPDADFSNYRAWEKYKKAVLSRLERKAAREKDADSRDKLKSIVKWCKLHVPISQAPQAEWDRWSVGCDDPRHEVPLPDLERERASEPGLSGAGGPLAAGDLPFKDVDSEAPRKIRAVTAAAPSGAERGMGGRPDESPAPAAAAPSDNPPDTASLEESSGDSRAGGGQPPAEEQGSPPPDDISQIKGLQQVEPPATGANTATDEELHGAAASGFDDRRRIMAQGDRDGAPIPGPVERPVGTSTRPRQAEPPPRLDSAPSGWSAMAEPGAAVSQLPDLEGAASAPASATAASKAKPRGGTRGPARSVSDTYLTPERLKTTRDEQETHDWYDLAKRGLTRTIGNPSALDAFFHPQDGATCGVVAQEQWLRLHGYAVDEHGLFLKAVKDGSFLPVKLRCGSKDCFVFYFRGAFGLYEFEGKTAKKMAYDPAKPPFKIPDPTHPGKSWTGMSLEEVDRELGGMKPGRTGDLIREVAGVDVVNMAMPHLGPFIKNASLSRAQSLSELEESVVLPRNREALVKVLERREIAIVSLDPGQLWHDKRYNNTLHTVTVTAVEVDRRNGGVLGYYINDSGALGGVEHRLVNRRQFERAWIDDELQLVYVK